MDVVTRHLAVAPPDPNSTYSGGTNANVNIVALVDLPNQPTRYYEIQSTGWVDRTPPGVSGNLGTRQRIRRARLAVGEKHALRLDLDRREPVDQLHVVRVRRHRIQLDHFRAHRGEPGGQLRQRAFRPG